MVLHIEIFKNSEYILRTTLTVKDYKLIVQITLKYYTFFGRSEIHSPWDSQVKSVLPLGRAPKWNVGEIKLREFFNWIYT